jgi:hypothetical protein
LPRVRARRADVDAAGFVVVPRAGGKARRVDDLALVFGRELIRRRSDGGLIGEQDGRTRTLGDAACRGRVLFAEPERNVLLIGCALAKKPGRLGVDLVTAGSRRSLAIDVAELLTDEPVSPGVRLFPLYPGADTVLFDAERQTLRRFEPGDAILAVYEQRALVRRSRTALVYDARTDRITTLPGKLEPLFETLQTGPMVYVGSLVVDLGTGRCVGSVSGRALAVSSSGEVLLATVPASAEALARGPLLWRAPEPVR